MFKKALISIVVLSFLLAPIMVGAAVPTNQINPIGNVPGSTQSGLRGGTLIGFIESGIKVVLGIVGAILLILIIYGGFTYATAAGSEEKVKKGRNILTYAIIGIVIIAVAWILTDYIIGNILIGDTTTTTTTTTTP